MFGYMLEEWDPVLTPGYGFISPAFILVFHINENFLKMTELSYTTGGKLKSIIQKYEGQ